MIKVERLSDGVVHAVIDRPARRNAVDLDTLVQLTDAVNDATVSGARSFVLSGANGTFCAGADLTGVENAEFAAALRTTLETLCTTPMPVIAAIDGPALGGGMQLAMACDLRIASERSVFGIPAAKLGLAVDHWTATRLAHEVGASTARVILFAAERLTTNRMFHLGFVHHVGSITDALAWADEIALLAPLTIAAHKAALRLPADDPEVERSAAAAWDSADAHEGRTAFLEKRPPVFRGR